MSKTDGQLSLFDLDTWFGKMCPEPSVQESHTAKISALSSKKPRELQTAEYLYLDLRAGYGNLLGPYWESNSPLLGEYWTLNTGASRSAAAESSLSQILEDTAPDKYCLSKTACLGILRRAKTRGKALPPQLEAALKAQVESANFPPDEPVRMTKGSRVPKVLRIYTAAMAAAAIWMRKSAAKNNSEDYPCVMTAGFCANASSEARSIGYQEECAPTLKGASSGTPTVICLNDQGGERMDVYENITGTLLAQMDGHPPLVLTDDRAETGNSQTRLYENHGVDSRYTGPHEVSPTISARAGSGGNNLPLLVDSEQDGETYCIAGNIIGREDENGGNGLGYQPEISYTVTSTDKHCVYSNQRNNIIESADMPYQKVVGTIMHGDHKGIGNQYVSDDKCIVEKRNRIRRLIPLECERLQGFPDYWTDIGGSDNARYKSLGNSVAIPCVEFVLRGIAYFLLNQKDKEEHEK